MKTKKSLSDFAIFGGKPTFQRQLHVGCPNIGNRDSFLRRINDILDKRWLTNRGKYVQEFEHKVSELIGVKHCIAMCNATVALEIAIRALDLKGEVILPSMTFVATAHALQWQEITPVFCDINPETLCIDPAKIEKLITPRTSGIIGVHLFGQSCDVDALKKIASHYNLKLMFDAAHAFGCSRQGQFIGGNGNAEVFSFHATKFINTFEGGAIVTNDDVLAKKIRLMKNFGFEGLDNVIYLGTNGKMSEISAAMGLTSLEIMHELVNINRRNYFLYKELLSDIPGISLRNYNEKEKNNFQYIVLTIDSDITGISRDELLEILKAENILARRYFYPGCHRMEPYRSYYPNAYLLLPNTEKINQELIQLPTGNAVVPLEIEKICNIITMSVQNSKVLRPLFENGQRKCDIPQTVCQIPSSENAGDSTEKISIIG